MSDSELQNWSLFFWRDQPIRDRLLSHHGDPQSGETGELRQEHSRYSRQCKTNESPHGVLLEVMDKEFLSPDETFYSGQRLSIEGALCTIRYYGPLANTKGQWLGVEWDDPSRGKHNGQYQGKPIFQCLSPSPTAASFIRPSRSTDLERTFLEAVRFKYGDESHGGILSTSSRPQSQGTILTESSVEISGKAVEEVGFDRIRQEQAMLENLKIVVVDSLCVTGPRSREDRAEIGKSCPNIVELDLGWNLLETLTEIADICLPLQKLRILKLSGLRFRSLALPVVGENFWPFRNIEELHLNECQLTAKQICEVVQQVQDFFPSLKMLSLSTNSIATFPKATESSTAPQAATVTTLMLENNDFLSLRDLPLILQAFPRLESLALQGNRISNIGLPVANHHTSSSTYPSLETLNLSRNQISSFTFIDCLPTIFPNLVSLRISSNPLFAPAQPASATLSATKHSAAAYFLTLARIRTLQTLNYTTIPQRDREEGEIYYLSVAEKSISPILQSSAHDPIALAKAIQAARTQYPRYEELCGIYERDSLLARALLTPAELIAASAQATTYPPGALGARLIKTTFYIPLNTTNTATTSSAMTANTSPPPTSPVSFTRRLPRTIDVYRLKALLSRILHLPPLQFRLIYESPELDPVKDDLNASASWGDWGDWGDWDVDGESESISGSGGENSNDTQDRGERWVNGVLLREGTRWKHREIELLDGFREWGFLVEEGVGEARVRVEVLS